ncbi:MAG: hypothetical protein HYR66_03110 [Sphingobacteriales bacterium]|nr:hypothetical protein [Sphingobacteriales bacterium]MBI3719253.1 hypothetical protein [Sphingobacteriales bacterium]
MTTRRTVDSKAGTLKTMSKLTGKSALAKLFTIAALSLMAVCTMSFTQKDDTAAANNMLAANTEVVTSDSNADVVTLNKAKFPKVILSREFVNALRNIKLDVAKADREVVKSLYLAEKAKKEALKFYHNSTENMGAAEKEVNEAMKFEALKYAFNVGNEFAADDANDEVSEHMKLTSIKLSVNAAMLNDVMSADEEVAAGVTEKSPETAVANFMKSSSKNIADADAEINSTISTKNTVAKKK